MATPPTPPSPEQPQPCQHRNCNQATIKRGSYGPDRLYCSNRCRQAEYRARKAQQGPGHAPPPQPAELPLQQAMKLIEQELPDLTQQQLQSAYGRNLLEAHQRLAAASQQASRR